MSAEISRPSLESAIIQASRNIKRNQATGCYAEEELDTLILAWSRLADYYSNYADNDIGVEIVGLYLDWVDRLEIRLSAPDITADCRELVDDYLGELRHQMMDIVGLVNNRLYPEG